MRFKSIAGKREEERRQHGADIRVRAFGHGRPPAAKSRFVRKSRPSIWHPGRRIQAEAAGRWCFRGEAPLETGEILTTPSSLRRLGEEGTRGLAAS
jgi:hypothetical protein